MIEGAVNFSCVEISCFDFDAGGPDFYRRAVNMSVGPNAVQAVVNRDLLLPRDFSGDICSLRNGRRST